MQILVLFWTALLGSAFWPVPVSATCVLYGSQLGWPPLLVGLVTATAQSVGFALLYFGGRWLLDRWTSLARRVESQRQRWIALLQRGFLPATLCGGVAGVPPMLVLATLAPAFEAPLLPFLLLAFVGRAVRFTIMAGAGQALATWLAG
jgi:membrane protein YqaA with SNARE-associated domain